MGNAAASTVLQFGSTFVLLAVTPYLLGTLGLEAYGLWALLNRLGRYGMLTDFGLGPSITRHVAQYAARDDSFSVRATTTIGVLYWLAVSGFIIGAAYLAGPWLLRGIALSPALRSEAPLLLVLVVGAWVLSLTLWGTMSATLNGLGLLRMTAAIGAAGTLAFAASAVLLLLAGAGIHGLVAAAYVQTAVVASAGYALLRRTLGASLVNPLAIPRSLYGEIVRFGGWVQVATIGSLIVDDAPAVVLGFLVGVQAVALFDIGTRLARVVRNLAYNFNSAFLPMISAVHAEDGVKRASRVFAGANRFMGLVSFASTGLVIATAPLLLQAWLGRGFEGARSVITIVDVLAVVYLIESITGVAITAIRGTGKPWLGAWYSAAYALAVVGLSLALTPHFGLGGVLAALVAGSAFASAAFFAAGAKSAELAGSLGAAAAWIVRAALATAGATAIFAFAEMRFGLQRLDRLSAAGVVTLEAAGYVLLLTAALRAVHFFSNRDFDIAAALVPRRLSPLLNARVLRSLLVRS